MSFYGSIEDLLVMQKPTSLPLPKQVKNLIGEYDHGPNCWNATMMWHEPSEPIGYTSHIDMEYWLSNLTCPISEADIRNGDIVIFRLFDELVHTAILVDNDTFFHKIGFSGPWVLQSREQLDIVYKGDYDSVEYRRYSNEEQRKAA